MKLHIKYLIPLFLTLFMLAACGDEDDGSDDTNTSASSISRTVLIYMAGDNSLSSYVNKSLSAIKEGILKEGLNNGNLLIYTDRKSGTPSLFQLVVENDTIRQIDIETYDENQSSASAEVLAQILDRVVSDYPADSYGLVLWSHGTGWLPYDYERYLTPSANLRSFGMDSNDNTIELNELADVLSDYHFDFILFDACYMASIEVVYALRGSADYIIASPTELLADGFPYQNFMGAMFEDKADVVGMATAFYNYYMNLQGTISVINCDALDQLAATCQAIFQDKTEEELFAVEVADLQIMEYLTSRYHALYDFDDYVSRLATSDQYATFSENLAEAVTYKAATSRSAYAYGGGLYLSIDHYSGLSVYVPQEALSALNEWYQDLDWYKAVYQ